MNLSSIIQNLFKGMLNCVRNYTYNSLYHSDGPIKVQMKCSQVTRQVFCRFYFQNTADEDYYILEDNTPLEGLRYPYLTISQGDKVIEYRGIHVSRMAPTKKRYVLIEAGKTITSPVVDLTSSYKFDSDGIYTIEYTKPFAYISDAEMSNVEEDDILPYTATHHSALVASTEVKLVDTYNFKPTNVEMELETLDFRETTSITYNDEVETQAIMQFELDESSLKGITKKVQRETKEAHDLVCEHGYPLASADVENNHNKIPYTEFFGTEPQWKVQKVINTCLGAVQNNQKKMKYSFRGSECKADSADIAYSTYGTPQINLCEIFEGMPTKRTSWFTSYHTKFETIAHEMTHIYANTKDYMYGHKECKKYAESHSDEATKNADSYGNYIQKVYYDS